MKKLALLLVIILASCSEESMDIPQDNLYDLTITTTIKSETYNTFNHVIHNTVRMSDIDFFRISSERLASEKSLRPAGVTVTETSNPKIVITKTVTHNVKKSK